MRSMQFKPLKKDEKIGFALGGKGKRCEVDGVRENSQAYWKGIKKGYKVVKVNDKEATDITVKTLLADVCNGSRPFSITMLVPNKPDWGDDGADPNKDPRSRRGKADDAPDAENKKEKEVEEPDYAAKDNSGSQQEEKKRDDPPIIDPDANKVLVDPLDDDDPMFPSAKSKPP